MKASSFSAFDATLYRAGLHLCPPAFRRDFSAEMLRDFDAATTDARSSGRHRDIWAVRAQLGADLARTIAVQWLRTGLPLIAVVALAVALFAAASLVSLWPRLYIDLPAGTADADVIALALLAVTVVIFIAATIISTLWSMPLLLGRRRRARHSLHVHTHVRLRS